MCSDIYSEQRQCPMLMDCFPWNRWGKNEIGNKKKEIGWRWGKWQRYVNNKLNNDIVADKYFIVFCLWGFDKKGMDEKT